MNPGRKKSLNPWKTFNAGVYGGGPPFSLTLPTIPPIIADLLATGTYYASATVKGPDGADWTCGYARIEITT